jgi:hypothetical protein
MSENTGFGPAPARLLLVASAVAALLALPLPWFAQYSGDNEVPYELEHQWTGWHLWVESGQDDFVPLDVVLALPLVAAVIALLVVACLAGPGPRQRRTAWLATGLGAALVVAGIWLDIHVSGLSGFDGEKTNANGSLFGLNVWRVALVMYVVAAARLVVLLPPDDDEEWAGRPDPGTSYGRSR